MITTAFFWEYLAASVAVYWLLPCRLRLGFLALVSVAYLATQQATGSRVPPLIHASALCALAGACYVLGPRTARAKSGGPAGFWKDAGRRAVFWGLIALILAYLVTCKYLLARHHDASLSAYVVPLGISYIAFRLIHTTIEFARGTIPQRDLGSFFASVFAFPTLAAGPIERYDHFLTNRPATFDPDDLLQGVSRILIGLVKRFFIAEQFFGHSWSFVNDGHLAEALPHIAPLRVWRLALFCLIYMYLDFSAYSDIAIGCCRLFGLRIMENFDWPLIAPNLPTFWRRWHMTLTGWCQSYVFMPVLGVWRSPKLATFTTFLVIGLWHGSAAATWPWALWGAYHGTGMIAHQSWAQLKRRRKWAWCGTWWWYACGIVITLAFVSVGDLVALFGPTHPQQVGVLFLRLAFIGGYRPT